MLRFIRRSVVGGAASAKSGGSRELGQPTTANPWQHRMLISWLRRSWQGQMALFQTCSNNPTIPLPFVNQARNARAPLMVIDWCNMRCQSVAHFTTPHAETAKALTPPHLEIPAWKSLRVLSVRCQNIISPLRPRLCEGQ
jgi:hypothetical protein